MSEATPKVTDASFENDVLKSNVPVLVDFWAEWCGPCRLLGPILEEVAPSYEGKIKIVKLNVDENSDSGTKFGVMSIPTMLFFKAGKEVDRVVGAVSKNEVQNRIDKILAA